MTAPTPLMIPSTSMSFTGPSGMWVAMKPPSRLTAASIQSIGYCPMTNVAVNITSRIRKKMGKPRYLFVSTLSMRCVVWYVSFLSPVEKPASSSAPWMKPYLASMMAVSLSLPVSSFTRAAAVSRCRKISAESPSGAMSCSTSLSCSRSLMAR